MLDFIVGNPMKAVEDSGNCDDGVRYSCFSVFHMVACTGE